MLDGVRAAINTVVVGTPLVGGAVLFLVATTRGRGGFYGRAVGGALFGGTAAGVWEYTVNSSDAPALKWEIILGNAAIGAGAGAFGPPLIGMMPFGVQAALL